MRAIIIEGFGGPEVIKHADMPKPEVFQGEVLIKIAYAGVNPVDWKIREGRLKTLFPHEFPVILGWECAGIVEEVDHTTCGLAVGDLVHTYCRKEIVHQGAFAECTTMHHTGVAPIPRSMGLKEAAVLPLAGLTAWQALFERKALREGMKVLIHAGAGGVGGYALQFARHAGAKVATTASAANHEYVSNFGADFTMDYSTADFVEESRAFAPDGFDFIFDTVGGETLRRSYEVLRPGGTLKSIVQEPDPELAGVEGADMSFVFVRPNAVQLQEIGVLMESGEVVPPEIEEFPLERAAEAVGKVEKGHTRGKIALKIS